MKGRTVLLVTHNILLASPIADYLIALNSDGTIRSQGTVEKLLKEDVVLKSVASRAMESAEGKEQYDEKEAEEQLRKEQGKQIAEEDVAVGRVTWPVCECVFGRLVDMLINSVVKLYLGSLGGPFFFGICGISMVFFTIQPVAVKGFLAYWSNQYETRPASEIPITKYAAGGTSV